MTYLTYTNTDQHDPDYFGGIFLRYSIFYVGTGLIWSIMRRGYFSRPMGLMPSGSRGGPMRPTSEEMVGLRPAFLGAWA
jgi:hypothetical protein